MLEFRFVLLSGNGLFWTLGRDLFIFRNHLGDDVDFCSFLWNLLFFFR